METGKMEKIWFMKHLFGNRWALMDQWGVRGTQRVVAVLHVIGCLETLCGNMAFFISENSSSTVTVCCLPYHICLQGLCYGLCQMASSVN